MENHRTKIFAVLFVFAFIFGGIYYWQKSKAVIPVNLPPQVSLASVESNVPTSNELETRAPNGKGSLLVKEVKVAEGINKIFYYIDEKGARNEFFSKVVPAGLELNVPYNTFSPDNSYMFLEEKQGDRSRYFALKTKPDSLPQEVVYFNELFNGKYPELTIESATGWGGMTLVVINAHDTEGSKYSFWFDASTGRFIALNNRFE
jgi:hypothetical protein